MQIRPWAPTVSILLGVVAASGCASRGYVQSRLAEVDAKVDALAEGLEDTARRARRNSELVESVDLKAGDALDTAESAGRSADQARLAASEADLAVGLLEEASRRLIFELVLTQDQAQFAFGQASLPEGAKVELDALVDRLKEQPYGVFLEVEGHTDSVGPGALNERLGLARAEAVRRYLHEQHRLPLHKISVISYGERQPVAPNDSREGRAQNRRVVIRVVA